MQRLRASSRPLPIATSGGPRKLRMTMRPGHLPDRLSALKASGFDDLMAGFTAAPCGANMGEIIRFVPKSERERARLIREARAIYDSIFPPADPVREQHHKAPIS